MKKKKRIVLGIIISIFLAVIAIALTLSSTNALFTHSDTSTRRNNYNTGLLSITAISKSDTISLDNTLPMSDENGILQEPYIFTVKNNGNVDYKFDIQLLSTTANTFDPQYIKLKVDNDSVTTLSALTDSKIKTNLVLAAGETVDISIRIWLDNNTPNSQIGKTFTSQLVINGIAVSPNTNYGSSAASYITNLYNNAAKTVVDNNGIEYNYATSESLMNDRLGGITKDYNAGNIRYYGANPKNYIWLGDYSDSQKTVKKLYRIIGVFDNMLKVVTEGDIGGYSWDTAALSIHDGWGINEWNQADLMKLLNPGYDDNEDLDNNGNSITVNNSLYWNKGSGTCYAGRSNATKLCDFTSSGLSNIEKNRIATATWMLGGNANLLDYVENYYVYERGNEHSDSSEDGVTRQDTWIGKIGLIYPSDYGYAVDFNTCNINVLYNFDTTCRSNDWLQHTSKPYWTISAYTEVGSIGGVWHINTLTGGNIGSASAGYKNGLVRPTFYLNADEVIVSGTGTSSDPYVLR